MKVGPTEREEFGVLICLANGKATSNEVLVQPTLIVILRVFQARTL